MPPGSSHPSHRRPLAREVLNRHDPAALIAIGCPPDEYDPELPDILEALQSAAAAPDPEPFLAAALLHLSRSQDW